MRRRPFRSILLLCLTLTSPSFAGEPYHRTADVIYGRKHGMALTMDVYRPTENANGAAVVWAASGGWVSAHTMVEPAAYAKSPIRPLVERGFTVFGVVMGSQPRFTVPELRDDLNRSVRFIRTHADEYGIDPDRIGVTGGSAGGHLSLLQATAGDLGDPKAKDIVDRASSRVQAVACLFPPTDFLNYGTPGVSGLGEGLLKGFPGAFAFKRLEKEGTYFGEFVRITDEDEIEKIGRNISPIYHVSPDDPPTLVIHGDADTLVPFQQAESFVADLKAQGVTAKLDRRKGAGHGWTEINKDWIIIADWFEEYLEAK